MGSTVASSKASSLAWLENIGLTPSFSSAPVPIQHERTTFCLSILLLKRLSILAPPVDWKASGRARLDMSQAPVNYSDSSYVTDACQLTERATQLAAAKLSSQENHGLAPAAVSCTAKPKKTQSHRLLARLSMGIQCVNFHRSAPGLTLCCHYISVVGASHLQFVLSPFCSTPIRFCSRLHDGGAGREPKGKRKRFSSTL